MRPANLIKLWALAALFPVLTAQSTWAQDTLVTVKGDFMAVKLLEVNSYSVIFNNADADSASIDSVDFGQVFMIKYRNGLKDVYPEHLEPIETEEPGRILSPEEMRQLGVADARMYVNPGKRVLAAGALSLASPIAGIIVALTTNGTAPPALHTTSNPDLLNEKEYINAYREEGRRIKKRKSLTGFLTGCGTYVLILGMIISESN